MGRPDQSDSRLSSILPANVCALIGAIVSGCSTWRMHGGSTGPPTLYPTTAYSIISPVASSPSHGTRNFDKVRRYVNLQPQFRRVFAVSAIMYYVYPLPARDVVSVSVSKPIKASASVSSRTDWQTPVSRNRGSRSW